MSGFIPNKEVLEIIEAILQKKNSKIYALNMECISNTQLIPCLSEQIVVNNPESSPEIKRKNNN